MRRLFPIQFLVLMAVIAIYTSFAYASSESPAPGAEGVSTISGWNVTGIHYSLEESSSKSSTVEFDLDAPADVVKISVNSSGSSFFDCVNTNGTHWYCVIGPEVGISEFNELKVIAK